MITYRKVNRPWWWPFGGTSSWGGWTENAPCAVEVTTASGTHPCGERGAHYQHRCPDPECGFRWAK